MRGEETKQSSHCMFSCNMKFKTTRNATEEDVILPSVSREGPFSVPLAKLGESSGKKLTLSRLVLFLPPLCLRFRGFELQNIMVGFIKKY